MEAEFCGKSSDEVEGSPSIEDGGGPGVIAVMNGGMAVRAAVVKCWFAVLMQGLSVVTTASISSSYGNT